ncbi:sugar transferase [Wenzhouxiangella sp. EGI_FJ10305]|uniref:sugar transferase n=1 Tax=Wenzhouxiangella sp. EGI_FJ10305 TaxID=3243768 RepID=UPI0035D61F2A
MKRQFDIVLAVIGLVVAAPLMAFIAVAIKVDSPGRVIFSQKRLGQGGEVFYIHKFRKFPGHWGTEGSGVTVAGDARMTRLGRILERSKLDELPQLWNILKGEMSFVGPRPESLNFAHLFTGELSKVHDYKPGIFGPNQVAYRNEAEMYPPDRDPDEFYRTELFPAKARNDIAYFSRATLLSDIGWMIRGIWVSLVEAVNWGRLIRQRGIHVAYDASAVVIAWIGANLLRFDGLPFGRHQEVFMHGTWILPPVILALLVIGGCYRQPVRHFSLGGTVRLFSAVTIGFAFFTVLAMTLVYRDLSIMVLPLAGFMTFTLTVAGRLYYRERWRNFNNGRNGIVQTYRMAIYGAGRRGGALAALIKQGFPEANVVGFIDDKDSEMRGREIQGTRVLGCERDLGTIQAVHGLDQLWTTFKPDAPKERRLRQWCDRNHVKLVVLPQTSAFSELEGAARRRQPVEPEPESHSPEGVTVRG